MRSGMNYQSSHADNQDVMLTKTLVFLALMYSTEAFQNIRDLRNLESNVTGIADRLNEPAHIRVIETRSIHKGHVAILQHSSTIL